MAHSPLGLSAEQAEAEVRHAWKSSYSPSAMSSAIERLEDAPLVDRIMHLCARLAFRGIYFPQMGRREYVRLLIENRGVILNLAKQAMEMKFTTSQAGPLLSASCRRDSSGR